MRWLLTALLVLWCLPALADTAQDLTAECVFTGNARSTDYSVLWDGDYDTRYAMNTEQGEMTIACPTPIGGLFIQLYDRYNQPLSYDVQTRDAAGNWQTVAAGGTYLAEWQPLPEAAGEVRILATSVERLRIAELTVYGEGEPPARVERWEELDKADLMLLSCHPDDEILWFGGLLPTYAGERGLKVQPVVMVPTEGCRKLELLSALWHCGVHYYPYFLGFTDNRATSLAGMYEKWVNKPTVCSRIVRAIRIYRPEVLVTHGLDGEYGHKGHMATADAAVTAFEEAANPAIYTKSGEMYGGWQVKKLYLHGDFGGGQRLDWDSPLAAFGGKTGYEVAEEAFAFHRSQIARDWQFERGGEHDNAVFTLYRTTVGPDSGAGDLMEHIGEQDAAAAR